MATAVLEIKVDSSGAVVGVNQLDRSLKNLGQTGDRTRSSLDTLAKFAATAFAFDKIIGGFKSVMNAGAQFEQSMANLRAITGQGGAALDFLGKKARELGATTTLSASEVVKGFEIVGSAMPQLLSNSSALSKVTEDVITLAEAAGITMPEAANALTDAMNQFQLPAEQSSRVINVLAAGAREGSANIPQLTAALSYAGVAAKGAGISFEETVATLEVLAQAGLKGERGGTALRTVLAKLSSETESGLNPTMTDFATVLENLEAKGLTAAEFAKKFGLEAKDAAAFIASNADMVDRLTNSVTNTSEAHRQQAARTDTLQGKIKGLSSAWEEFKLSLNDNSGAAFDWIIEKITHVVRFADYFVDHLEVAFFQFFASAQNAVQSAAVAIKGTFGEAIRFVVDKIRGAVQGIANISNSLGEMFGLGNVNAYADTLTHLNSVISDIDKANQGLADELERDKEIRAQVVEEMKKETEQRLAIIPIIGEEIDGRKDSAETMTEEEKARLALKVKVDEYIASLESEVAALEQEGDAYALHLIAKEHGIAATSEEAKEILNLTRERDGLIEGLKDEERQRQANEQAVERIKNQLERENSELRFEIQQLGRSTEEQIRWSIAKELGTDASDAFVVALAKERVELLREKEALEASEQAARQLQGQLSGIFKDFMTDALSGDIEDAFENLFDNILESFTEMIAEMIAQAAALAVIQTYTGGGNGQNFGQNFMSALNGNQNNFSQISNLFGGGNNNVMTGVNTSAQSGQGLGVLGGVEAVNGGATSASSFGAAAGAAFAGVVVAALVLGTADLFWGIFNGTDKTGEEIHLNIDGGQVSGFTREEFLDDNGIFGGSNRFNVDTAISDAVAAQLTDILSSALTPLISSLDQVGLGSGSIEDFSFSTRILSRGMSPEEIEAALTGEIERAIEEFVKQSAPALAIFRKEGESYIDVLNRMNQANQTSEMMKGFGFDPATMVSQEFLAQAEAGYLAILQAPITNAIEGLKQENRDIRKEMIFSDDNTAAIEQIQANVAEIQALEEQLGDVALSSEQVAEAHRAAVLEWVSQLEDALGGADEVRAMFDLYTELFVGAQASMVSQVENAAETARQNFDILAGDLGTSRDTFQQDFEAALASGDTGLIADFNAAMQALAQLLQAEQQLALARGEAIQLTSLTATQVETLTDVAQGYASTIERVTGATVAVDDAFLQFVLDLDAAGVSFQEFGGYVNEFIKKFVPEEEQLKAKLEGATGILDALSEAFGAQFGDFGSLLADAFSQQDAEGGVAQSVADALREQFRNLGEAVFGSNDENLIAQFGPLIAIIDDLISSLTVLGDEASDTGDDIDDASSALADAQSRWESITSAIQSASSAISQSITDIQSASLGGGSVAGAGPGIDTAIANRRGLLGQGSIEDQIRNVLELQGLIADRFNQEKSLIESVMNAEIEAQRATFEAERRAHEERNRMIIEQARAEYEAQKRLFNEQMQQYQRLQSAAQSLRAFIDDLLVSEYSQLTPEQRLDQALADFNSLLAQALGGDVDAMEQLQAMATTVLDLARDMFASSQAFDEIFNMVVSGLEQAIGVADVAVAPTEPVWVEPMVQEFNKSFSVNTAAIQEAQDALSALQADAIEELKGLQEELDRLQALADEELEEAKKLAADAQQAQIETRDSVTELIAPTKRMEVTADSSLGKLSNLDGNISIQSRRLEDQIAILSTMSAQTADPIVSQIERMMNAQASQNKAVISELEEVASQVVAALGQLGEDTVQANTESGGQGDLLDLLRQIRDAIAGDRGR